MYVFDNFYTSGELILLVRSFLLTRLFYPRANLIRRPVLVRGKPRIAWGRGLTTGQHCRLETFGDRNDSEIKLRFGDECHIGDYVHIAAAESISIGDRCLFASRVFISDLDHGMYSGKECDKPNSNPNDRALFTSPVVIGNGVWVGEGACILKGVHIGDGSIIGANAVVTRDIPAGSIAGGIPAKVIKMYSPTEKQWLSVKDGARR